MCFSGSEGGDDDSDDPQVYESMFNIQSQAGSSDTTQASDLGNLLQFTFTSALINIYGKPSLLECIKSNWSAQQRQ